MKNLGARGRFIAIFSTVSLSFLGGLFKFTADGLKEYPDVSQYSARCAPAKHKHSTALEYVHLE